MDGWEGEAPAEPDVFVEGKQNAAHREVRPPGWGQRCGRMGGRGSRRAGCAGGGLTKSGSPGGSPSRLETTVWRDGRARLLPSRVFWWAVNKKRLTRRFALPIGDNGMGRWEGKSSRRSQPMAGFVGVNNFRVSSPTLLFSALIPHSAIGSFLRLCGCVNEKRRAICQLCGCEKQENRMSAQTRVFRRPCGFSNGWKNSRAFFQCSKSWAKTALL